MLPQFQGKSDKSYFISAPELIKWINQTLNLNIESLNEISKGVIPCLLIKQMNPESLNQNKIKMNSLNDSDSFDNFKLFQRALTAIGINKPIEIDFIIQKNFKYVLEFAQWLKKMVVENEANLKSKFIDEEDVNKILMERLNKKKHFAKFSYLSPNLGIAKKKNEYKLPYRLEEVDKITFQEPQIILENIQSNFFESEFKNILNTKIKMIYSILNDSEIAEEKEKIQNLNKEFEYKINFDFNFN